LGLPASEVEPGMAALHFQALLAGVRILRVHDVAPAHQVVSLWRAYQEPVV
jgi:dihydropteroate synthase